MKSWKIFGMAFLLFLCQITAVSGAQCPLTAVTEYGNGRKEVTIWIVTEKPTALESFTMSVKYNMDVYKLYNGNDVVLGGYAYEEAFETFCGTQGMLLSNALDGKVIFSGVNSNGQMYDGVIARVSLLKYSDKEASESDISLEIQTLGTAGEETNQQPIVITPKEDTEGIYIQEQPAQAAEQNRTDVRNEEAEGINAGAEQISTLSETPAGSGQEADNGSAKQGTAVSLDGTEATAPASAEEKEQPASEKKDSSDQNTSKKDKKKPVFWVCVCVVLAVAAAGAAVWIIRLRRRG